MLSGVIVAVLLGGKHEPLLLFSVRMVGYIELFARIVLLLTTGFQCESEIVLHASLLLSSLRLQLNDVLVPAIVAETCFGYLFLNDKHEVNAG